MLITPQEIVDILIMIFAIGFIFKDMFKRIPKPHHHRDYDPLLHMKKSDFWEDLKHSMMIAAPAIVLHEFAHKFVAMSYGATATLHAPYTMYAIVIALKLINFPLIFFVGGYVAHTALAPFPSAMVSIAGPLTNFIIFLLCTAAVKYNWIHKKYHPMVFIMGKLNLFLSIFNMLPIRGFDGYNFFQSIMQVFA